MSETLQIKIRADHAAATDDALGRQRCGWFDGITADDAWHRGRGEWSLDPTRAFNAATVEIVNDDDVVISVATVEAMIRTKPGKYVIEGTVIADDPRIGHTSPHRHPSRNRINYY